MAYIPFQGLTPKVAEDVFVAEGVRIIGDVSIAGQANIWFNTVIRGDVNRIVIGEYTNIQDNCTLHVADPNPCMVGRFVTVGHGAVLHGCTVQDNCLIGMGAIVLNGAIIGENSIVGAGALVTENKVIPPNSLVVGAPARVIRTITTAEFEAIRESAYEYHNLSCNYKLNSILAK